MDENSAACKPLLSTEFNDKGYVKKTTLFKPLIKWTLKILMWVVFIAWIVIIFLYPGGEFFHDVFESWVDVTSKTPFGETGSYFLLFSAPILIIAVLAIFHLIVFGEDEDFLDKNSLKQARFRLWTFPVLVDGPFGVVSAAELIGIFLVLLYVIWATWSYAVYDLKLIKGFKLPPKDQNLFMVELTGSRMGNIGLFCMAFLFLPVSRGSVLLRLIDIPFEHATRYHVWLGHLTMVLFTLHGLLFVIAWKIQGTLYEKIISWSNDAFAYLPGVISLLAGLLMWVTSMPPVRKMNFELFFYTHQLYVVFVVFLAMHVGDFIFSIAAGGIFLFTLDRFLRFCQSRRTVKVISAKCLPCGTMELVFSKPKGLRYNALSFIFLQVRELSWLQWHPFSVSSSPLDGPNHVAVLIKVLGGWTEKLKQTILSINEAEPTSVQTVQTPAGITASVEGPYGHELPYHLMYENLILVAGGIGISPFLAILSDILHRIRDGKPCLPRNVVIVWAIKRSNELPILSTIDMESICPSFSDKLNLSVRIYVTRELEPPLEEGKHDDVPSSSVCPFSKGCGISGLVGTGDNLWSGLYVISSIVGFIILMSLLEVFYVNPYGIHAWWYKGLLFTVCMLASVILFGGLVVALWHLREKKLSEKEVVNGADKVGLCEPFEYTNQNQKGAASSTIIHYGTRPDFREIFRNIGEKWGSVDVGVIVCGPETLQSSVAKECRTQSLRRQQHYPVYHFHSHSFDL